MSANFSYTALESASRNGNLLAIEPHSILVKCGTDGNSGGGAKPLKATATQTPTSLSLSVPRIRFGAKPPSNEASALIRVIRNSMSQPAAEATPDIPKSNTTDVLVQYFVLRQDLIDTWPTGSVVTQCYHASVSAIWSCKGDLTTLQYCSAENIDSMHKLFQPVTMARAGAVGFDIQGIGEELPWIRNLRGAGGQMKYCNDRAYPASPRVLTQLVPVVFQKAVNGVEIDDIIMEQQLIPVVFQKTVNGVEIDDIIMEQQLIPVVFQKAVNGVEIDPSAQTDYVEAGSMVELPLRLAYELHLKQVVKMKAYACFNHRTKLELGADGAAGSL
ncbi:hypothetical protein ACFX1X_020399 [Malus domestica]